MHYTGMYAGTSICTAAFPTAGWMPLRGGDLPYYVFDLATFVVVLIWLQLIATQLSPQRVQSGPALR